MVNSKKKDKKSPIVYMGMECDSSEELVFLYWCEELIKEGYIELVQRSASFFLSDKIVSTYKSIKKLKTKTNIKEITYPMMNSHSYTPDFTIYWTLKGAEKFGFVLGAEKKKYNSNLFVINKAINNTLISTVEIKSVFDYQNMERLFLINKKWMFDKYKVFVNLVKPQDLFKNTFTPEKFKLTPTGKDKKINFKTKTIKEFLYESTE